MEYIARIHTPFPEKFGIPRQSGLAANAKGTIVFEPKFRNPDAVKGIEEFSHLWLLWEFSRARQETFHATVAPPRLGGKERKGVFATRSPFRPNSIGLSCVKLEKVRIDENDGPLLVVSGVDLLDGTPIYDIKPYLSFSDSHPEAVNGFAEESKDYHLDVVWENINRDQVKTSTRVLHDSYTPPADIQREIAYILSQDPRPAYQDNPQREYKMDYGGWRVTFSAKKSTIFVKKTEKIKN